MSGELLTGGILALFIAIGLMMLYIWFSFGWQFGLGAVFALFHDVILTFGIFAIFHLEFDLRAVAAILTIIGYSMNDTVVVFDRLRENLRKFKKMPLADVINLSINETLSRTIITGLTAVLALAGLTFLGGETLFSFSVAMMFGIIIGTYSSIYVASPIILLWGVNRNAGDAEIIDMGGFKGAKKPRARCRKALTDTEGADCTFHKPHAQKWVAIFGNDMRPKKRTTEGNAPVVALTLLCWPKLLRYSLLRYSGAGHDRVFIEFPQYDRRLADPGRDIRRRLRLFRAGQYDVTFVVAVLRWAHVACGILWVGLLYYFNFVQIRVMPNIPAELKAGGQQIYRARGPVLVPLGGAADRYPGPDPCRPSRVSGANPDAGIW